MAFESLFIELDEVATFSGKLLYDELRNLGVVLRVFYGRLEIEQIEKIEENRLSVRQKEYFYEVLGGKVVELKKEYYRDNPQFCDIDYPKAYLSANDELIIPHNCHAKYRYWLRHSESAWKHLEKSMSLQDILAELHASPYITEKYLKGQ